MSYSFLALVFRQKYIHRWALMHSTQPETLSEHSMECAMVAHTLAVINNKILKGDANPEKTALFALYHDCTEVLCGDLPTPVKYYNEQMRETYRLIEKSSAERLLSSLPDELRDEYEDLLFEKCDNTTHRLVKTADKLCAYIKCLKEVKGGNDEFKAALQATETSVLEEYCFDETKYFLENFLPAFNMTLDEM